MPVDAMPIVSTRAPDAYELELAAVAAAAESRGDGGWGGGESVVELRGAAPPRPLVISRPGPATSSRETESAPAPPHRGARPSPRTHAWTSGGRDRGCCPGPAGTPRGRR